MVVPPQPDWVKAVVREVAAETWAKARRPGSGNWTRAVATAVTTSTYATAALALLRSVRAAGTALPFVCLVTEDLTRAELDRLRSAGFVLFPVAALLILRTFRAHTTALPCR